MLRSVPSRDSMDMDKEYDDDNWLRRSNLSQRLMQ